MKRLFLLILIFISLKVSAQQTYFTPGVPGSSIRFAPIWGFLGIDSLANFYLGNSNRWSQIYTATQSNLKFALKSTVYTKAYVDSLNTAIFANNHSYSGIPTFLNGAIFNKGGSTYAISTYNNSTSSYDPIAVGAINAQNGVNMYGGNFVIQPYNSLVFQSVFDNGNNWNITKNNEGLSAGDSYLVFQQGGNPHNKTMNAFAHLATDLVTLSDVDSLCAPISGSPNYIDTVGIQINVKRDFGAKGDAVKLQDVTVTASSTTIYSPSASFTSADIGKTVGLPYAGTDTLGAFVPKTFRAKIASVTDANHIVLTSAPIQSISGPRTVTGMSATAGNNVITITGGTFNTNDIGKQLKIPGTGPINNQNASETFNTFPVDSTQTAYIYAVTSSTTCLVSEKALYSTSNRLLAIPGAWMIYGSDDTSPIQNAVNTAIAGHKNIFLPQGKYLITSAINIGSNTTIEGAGAGNTIIYPVGYGFSALVNNHAASDTITTNTHFRRFEIDGMSVTSNVYDHTQKGILVLPCKDCSFENITIRNSAATGLGCDFMVNYIIANSKFVHNGRQGFEFGASQVIAGSAGVGIGAGKSPNEPGLIIGNYFENNYSFNSFVEGQSLGLFSTGCKMIGNSSTFAFLYAGFGDPGTDGTIIVNNSSIYDQSAIRSDISPYQTAANVSYAKNALYVGNKIKETFGTSIVVNTKYGGHIIKDNTISASITSPTSGIKIIGTDSTGTNIKDITVDGNKVTGIKGDGIDVQTGNSSETLATVILKNNLLIDNGLSTSSLGSGINILGKTTSLINQNNVAYDDRTTGSKTQGYAFNVSAAVTTGYYGESGNQYYNNATGAEIITNLTATVSNIGNPLVSNQNASPLAVTRIGTSANASIQIGDSGASWFVGKQSGGGFAISTSNNLASSPMLGLTATGFPNFSGIITAGVIHSAASTGLFSTSLIATADISANAITYAKIQTQANNTILGNNSGSTGVPSALTAAQVSSIIATATPQLITGTPTIAAGAGAGSSPTVSVTTNGKQLQVTVMTGTLPTGTNATIATVTLPNALSYTPYPTFSPANANTSLLSAASMVYMTSTGTANVTITSGTTALTAATTYIWNINL